MDAAYRDKLIGHVNRKKWWHVPPSDPDAYSKRGKFFAPSYREAEFWGRPLDEPQRVHIANPLIGDEEHIETLLLGKRVSREEISLDARWKLDARLKSSALKQGYDSIVLMTPKAFAGFLNSGKLSRSLELNLLQNAESQSH